MNKSILLTNAIIESFESRKISSNYKKYKTYIAIRRDLREAYYLLNECLKVSDEIFYENKLKEHQDNLLKYNAWFLHAITLYSRWFKSTDNKTQLNKFDYFKANNNLANIHDKIINLRDKYIAHNEENILGGDKIFLKIDGPEAQLCSFWEKQPWIQGETNLEDIIKCIELVHNEIDGKLLPKIQEVLERDLSANLNKMVL